MKRLLLLVGLLFWSCEDQREEDPIVSNIDMWLDGGEIPVEDYYEKVTTFGKAFISPEECQIGSHNPCDEYHMKKIFVIHFQKEDGRVTPEKEHYAVVFYDYNGLEDGNLIDEGVYVWPDTNVNQGINLEIVGLSDYTTAAQGVIRESADGRVSGIAEGNFYNPYREKFQNGLVVFENLEVGTDTSNTFYSEFY